MAADLQTFQSVLSASSQSGLKDGERREVSAERLRSLGGPTASAVADEIQYQQDRTIAFDGRAMPSTGSPGDHLENMLSDLAEKHQGIRSSAAATLVHVDVQDGPDGRTIALDAASLGDCDVFVAVKPANGGPATVQRLFDDEDFPDQFDAKSTALRKALNGIGDSTEPDVYRQTHSVHLQPGDTAVVFTGSDGFWDGYAGAGGHIGKGLAVKDAVAEMRTAIGQSVDRVLSDPDVPAAAQLVENLVSHSEDQRVGQTDNISTTALMIKGGQPPPPKVVLGSIDGSGTVGPTEAMVDSMVADIHDRFGPSLLAANDSSLKASAASRLGKWRSGDEAPAPAARSTPAPI